MPNYWLLFQLVTIPAVLSVVPVAPVAPVAPVTVTVPAVAALPAVPAFTAVPPKVPTFSTQPPAVINDWAYDKYKLTLDDMPPETCIGKMIRPGANAGEDEQYSVWVQYPAKKLLRFDIGYPGEPYFVQLYAFENSSYAVVTPGDNKDNKFCVKEAATFESVIGAYIYPYVRYLSDGVWHNKPVRFYAGISPDPFTQTSISNVAIIGLNKEYYAMAALSTSGYIYYDYNVTLGVPADDWFQLPAICGA